MDILYPTEGTYAIGATGSGKSSFLAHRMLEDYKKHIPFTLIDPKLDLADLIYGHVDEVTVLDVDSANFGINLFECQDPRQLDLVTDRVMQVFHKVFGMNRETNARLRQYLRNTAKLLILTNGTMRDVPRVLINKTYRETLLAQIREPTVREFWAYHASLTNREQQDRIESTYDRVDEFLGSRTAARIFSSHSSTIDWTSAFDTGQTIIVRLSPQLEQLSSLVGAVVMAQIAAAAFSRKERFQYSLYCDEYHRFATPATDDLLTQGRSFGMATTIAHQSRSQLDYHAKGATIQCANTIVFCVKPPDNDELAGIFEVPEEEGRVIGRIAKQAVDPKPVQTLLRNGHSNPNVRAIVLTHLSRLRVFYSASDSRYQDSSSIWQEGEARLNRYLFNFMEGTALLNPFMEATQILGIIDGFYEALTAWKVRVPQEDRGPILNCIENQLKGKPDWSVFAQHLFSKHHERGIRSRFAEKHEQLTRYPKLTGECLEFYERFVRENPTATDQHRAYFDTLLAHQHQLLDGEEAELLQTKQSEMTTSPFVLQIAESAIWIASLARYLQAEPIMVETDQFEEIRERPRSVADRQGEIANQLANLPRGTAWVKVRTVTGYHQAVEHFPPPPSSKNVFVSFPVPHELLIEEAEPEKPFFVYEEEEKLPPMTS